MEPFQPTIGRTLAAHAERAPAAIAIVTPGLQPLTFGELAGQIASRLPHGSLEVWKGRGHFGPLEDPELAVTSMLRFADATAPAS